MHSKIDLLVLPISLVLAFSSQAAFSQENLPSEEASPLSVVEDATLDGSNAEAASAANASPAAPTELPPAGTNEPAAVQSESSEKVTAETPENVSQGEMSQKNQDASQNDVTVANPVVEETPKPELTKTPEQNQNKDSGVKGIYGGRVFGRYRIQLAGNRPTFSEGQKCYEKFYGKPETYYSLSSDWFPLDWWINPGITMRLGSYSAKGKAASGNLQGSQVNSCDQLTVASNSTTSLLFMPMQIGGKIQITPFSRKWLVVDVWGAGEYGWWQETRDSASKSGQTYTNTGRKPAVSAGASVHLLLNYLDEQSVRSMLDSMDIGYVYLTGFAERVKSRNTAGLSFGRQVVGVGFTFETYK